MNSLRAGGRSLRAVLAVWAVMALCAAGTRAAGQPPAVSFNGGRAFKDLKRLVAFGPRPSGTEALEKSRQWMLAHLRQTGATVEEDRFTASTPIGPLPMVNLLAKFPGSSRRVVIVAGHYDTARQGGPHFVGANDGASSAALLLELARVLATQHHRLSVWLVFFDGEEAVKSWTDTDSLYGSRHMVSKLTADGDLGRVQALILVDMIGDAHLQIEREAGSTPWLTNLVFSAAQNLGYHRYFHGGPISVEDDHVPFLNAGVSAIDLIDFDYGPGNSYWHTARDTVEHCSPVSLTVVGRVVMASLDRLDNSPHTK